MEFLNKENKAFLDGTGVTTNALVETVSDFAAWHEENPDKQLTSFFKKKSNIDMRTLRVFALIGMKVIVDEVAKMSNDYLSETTEKKE